MAVSVVKKVWMAATGGRHVESVARCPSVQAYTVETRVKGNAIHYINKIDRCIHPIGHDAVKSFADHEGMKGYWKEPKLLEVAGEEPKQPAPQHFANVKEI